MNMDENKNLPVPKIDLKVTGDVNKGLTQIGSVFDLVPWFGEMLLNKKNKNTLIRECNEQERLAIANGLAWPNDKNEIVYFNEIEDPRIRAATRKEALKEIRQEKILDYVLEELENKKIKLEDMVIGVDTDTNYFNEEFLPYWDKYSDDMRRDDLQNLWAKILVQEMQNPHTISIRTMEFVKTLSTRDANIFNMILPYVIGKDTVPIMFNVIHPADLQYLEHRGLLLGNRNVTLEMNAMFLGKQAFKSNKLQFYCYSLSDIGKELYLIADVGDCDFDKLEEVFDNDDRVEVGDEISFHNLADKTECEPTFFRYYQKKEHKNDIVKKYAHLPKLSLKPNI